MQAGHIIKLAEQYNIHKKGSLGVLVNSKIDRYSKNKRFLTILFEDGHYIALGNSVPYLICGYNFEFDQAGDMFKTLHNRVKELGKTAFTKGKHCCEIDIVLTDNADRKTYFTVGFDNNGNYFQSDSTCDGEEQGDHTINAHIGDIWIDVDGNAWRDLEAGGYMPDFISDVIIGERDAGEFLVNISEALGTSDNHGRVF